MGTAVSLESHERPSAATELQVTVLMPCLNEAETIVACVAEAHAALARTGMAGEVLVSDNGSTDGSQDLAAAAGARRVDVPARGYGNSLAAGILAARGRYILMGDSDGSYNFGELPRFIERMRAGADLVIGCRLPAGGGQILPGAMPWSHRWVGNPVLSALGRLFFAAPVHDFHCGLRAFRREAVEGLGLSCPGMEYASEMVVRASTAGLRLAEVPVTLRLDGRTRPPHLRSWRDGWRHLRFMLLFSPRWLFLLPGMVLATMSLAVFLALLAGPVRIGTLTFDINTLILAGSGLVTGIQIVLVGVVAKAAAVGLGIAQPTPLLALLQGHGPVEFGLAAGALLILAGVGYTLWAVEQWREAGFGDLAPEESVRIVVPAVTAIAIGVQIACSGFALATIEFGRELRLRRARP